MGRKERLQERIVEAAGALGPGERVDVVGVAQVGKPSADLAASAAASIVTAALGAGPSLLGDKCYGVILTNERVIFVEIDKDFGKVKDGIAQEWPRNGLKASGPPTGRLMSSFDITDASGAPVMRLNFPRPARAEAEKINRALRG